MTDQAVALTKKELKTLCSLLEKYYRYNSSVYVPSVKDLPLIKVIAWVKEEIARQESK